MSAQQSLSNKGQAQEQKSSRRARTLGEWIDTIKDDPTHSLSDTPHDTPETSSHSVSAQENLSLDDSSHHSTKENNQHQDPHIEGLANSIRDLEDKINAASRKGAARPQHGAIDQDSVPEEIKSSQNGSIKEESNDTAEPFDTGRSNAQERQSTKKQSPLAKAVEEIRQRQAVLNKDAQNDLTTMAYNDSHVSLPWQQHTPPANPFLAQAQGEHTNPHQVSHAQEALSEDVKRLASIVENLSGSIPEPSMLERLNSEISVLRDALSQMPTSEALTTLEEGYAHVLRKIEELKTSGAAPDVLDSIYNEIGVLRDAIDKLDAGRSASEHLEHMRHLMIKLERDQRHQDPEMMAKILDEIHALSTDRQHEKTQEHVAQIVQRLVGIENHIEHFSNNSGAHSAFENQLKGIQTSIEELSRTQGNLQDVDQKLLQITSHLENFDADKAQLKDQEAFQGHFDLLREEVSKLQETKENSDFIDQKVDALTQQMQAILSSLQQGQNKADLLNIVVERVEKLCDLPQFEAALEKRFKSVEQLLSAAQSNSIQQQHIADSIAQLHTKMNALPADLPLKDIERSVIDLHQRIGTLATQSDNKALAEVIKSLASKVDKVSSQNVSSISPELEQKINHLTQAVQRLSEGDMIAHAVEQKFLDLHKRLDSLTSQNQDHHYRQFEGLSKQIGTLAQHITQNPSALAIEKRLQELNALFSKKSALTTEELAQLRTEMQTLKHSLQEVMRAETKEGFEAQFKKIAAEFAAAQAANDTKALKTLEQQIAYMANRLDGMSFSQDDFARMRNVMQEAVQQGARNGLEEQIRALSTRFEAAQKNNDTNALQNLEVQIGKVAKRLDLVASGIAPDTGPIQDILHRIEHHLHQNPTQNIIQPSALQEDALHAVHNEINSLKAASHHSDERLHSSLNTMNQTLSKVVHRIDQLENGQQHTKSFKTQSEISQQKAAPVKAETLSKSSPTAIKKPHVQEASSHNKKTLPAAPHAPETKAPLVLNTPNVGAPSAMDQSQLQASLDKLGEKFQPQKPQTSRHEAHADQPAPAWLKKNAKPQADADHNVQNKKDAPQDPHAQKANFIAAARRAATHASQEVGKAQKGTQKRLFSKLPFSKGINFKNAQTTPSSKNGTPWYKGSFRKPLLLGGTALVLIAGITQLYSSMGDSNLSNTQQSEQNTALIEAPQTQTSVNAEEKGFQNEPSRQAKELSELTPPPQKASSLSALDQSGDLEEDYASYVAGTLISPEANNEMDVLADENAIPAPQAPGLEQVSADLDDAIGPLSLRLAANSGDAKAAFEIATRYTEGRLVAQDLIKAAFWYEKAALNGLAPASYRLGSLYEKGNGVAKNPSAARSWYEYSAQQGNPKAMHNLAVMAAEGAEGQPNYEAAARWFEAASQRNVADSQYNLAVLYAKGLGVPRDLAESYKWFALAALQGDSDALSKRDEVASALGEDALALARLRVERWNAVPVDPSALEVLAPEGGWPETPGEEAQNLLKKTPLENLSQTDLIKQTQALLINNGFNAGTADGRMGPQTRRAILEFQIKNNLPQTGLADVNLLQTLQSI